jgi:hypothetical protein
MGRRRLTCGFSAVVVEGLAVSRACDSPVALPDLRARGRLDGACYPGSDQSRKSPAGSLKPSIGCGCYVTWPAVGFAVPRRTWMCRVAYSTMAKQFSRVRMSVPALRKSPAKLPAT